MLLFSSLWVYFLDYFFQVEQPPDTCFFYFIHPAYLTIQYTISESSHVFCSLNSTFVIYINSKNKTKTTSTTRTLYSFIIIKQTTAQRPDIALVDSLILFRFVEGIVNEVKKG